MTVRFTDDRGHDADSHYRVILTATDSNGQTATDEVRIDPETVRLTLSSSPEGAGLTYDGTTWVSGEAPDGPANDATIGFQTPVIAVPSFVKEGTTYVFDSWSNGGTREQNFEVPGVDTHLVASYVPLDTSLDSAPPATTRDPSPEIRFSSTLPGAGFECRLDDAPTFSACSSPFAPRPSRTARTPSRSVRPAAVRSTSPQPAARSPSILSSTPRRLERGRDRASEIRSPSSSRRGAPKHATPSSAARCASGDRAGARSSWR